MTTDNPLLSAILRQVESLRADDLRRKTLPAMRTMELEFVAAKIHHFTRGRSEEEQLAHLAEIRATAIGFAARAVWVAMVADGAGEQGTGGEHRGD
jgi:hypothetical protein